MNSHQLVVGLALLFLGLFWVAPEFDAPAIRTSGDGGPPMLPFLFVTIACGAISGFHALVASGTTSKQLNKLSDARLIGYGSMLGEGALALAATMTAVAGIGLVSGHASLPSQGHVDSLNWAIYYEDWSHASANGSTAFVLGGGAFLERLGISTSLARTLMAVMVISFASTTLDTATRIERFIISELGSALGLSSLKNPYVATALAVIPAIVLATWTVPDPVTGRVREAAWLLWPIFGASNQLIAALTFLVMALYFWQRKRPVMPLVIPMILVMIITLFSLILKTKEFYVQGNDLLFAISALLLTLMLWMNFEGMLMFKQVLRSRRDLDDTQKSRPGA